MEIKRKMYHKDNICLPASHLIHVNMNSRPQCALYEAVYGSSPLSTECKYTP